MITFATASPILAIFDVGGGEMILIFVVILLLFGGKRMPELARGLGKSINEFKKATSGVEAQLKQAIEDVRETAVTPVQKTITAAVAPVTEESPPARSDTPPTTPPASSADDRPASPPQDTR